MILQETIDFILKQAKQDIENYTIDRVFIGALFTAVQLSSGYCGLAKTEFTGSIRHGKQSSDTTFEPGKYTGSSLFKLLNTNEINGFLKTVQLAAINALSAEWLFNSNYTIIENADPLDLINVDGKRIAMVGAFYSYIKRLSQQNCTLKVLELDENAFDEEEKKYYVPANQSSKIFSNADIAIITGSALVNNTMDQLLSEIPLNVQIIVVGPTGGIIPKFLFDKNVSIIGATRVLNADMLFKMIAEGASGYHLFQYGAAQKICILNE
ncbi:MAG: Rossmann-like domain-containing protein [Bacteroidales bacterium]